MVLVTFWLTEKVGIRNRRKKYTLQRSLMLSAEPVSWIGRKCFITKHLDSSCLRSISKWSCFPGITASMFGLKTSYVACVSLFYCSIRAVRRVDFISHPTPRCTPRNPPPPAKDTEETHTHIQKPLPAKPICFVMATLSPPAGEWWCHSGERTGEQAGTPPELQDYRELGFRVNRSWHGEKPSAQGAWALCKQTSALFDKERIEFWKFDIRSKIPVSVILRESARSSFSSPADLYGSFVRLSGFKSWGLNRTWSGWRSAG